MDLREREVKGRTGRSGERGNCGQDVIYDRRIKLLYNLDSFLKRQSLRDKTKPQISQESQGWWLPSPATQQY